MPLRILIVEDEPVVALHLESIVTDAGHTVVGMASTMRAARLIAKQSLPIDLAIMDIDLLTKPDGIETARRLRDDHAISSLFVTAHLTDENVAKAEDVEPLGFIGKPFIDEQIIAAIRLFLGPLEQPNVEAEPGLKAARRSGFDAGAIAGNGAGICPWPQGDARRDLRWAWLLGFAEGRVSSR